MISLEENLREHFTFEMFVDYRKEWNEKRTNEWFDTQKNQDAYKRWILLHSRSLPSLIEYLASVISVPVKYVELNLLRLWRFLPLDLEHGGSSQYLQVRRARYISRYSLQILDELDTFLLKTSKKLNTNNPKAYILETPDELANDIVQHDVGATLLKRELLETPLLNWGHLLRRTHTKEGPRSHIQKASICRRRMNKLCVTCENTNEGFEVLGLWKLLVDGEVISERFMDRNSQKGAIIRMVFSYPSSLPTLYWGDFVATCDLGKDWEDEDSDYRVSDNENSSAENSDAKNWDTEDSDTEGSDIEYSDKEYSDIKDLNAKNWDTEDSDITEDSDN
jgi:hypothetical protein